MLPDFVDLNRVNTSWMLDFDNSQWFWFDAENGRLLTKQPNPSKRGTFEAGLRRRI